MKFKLTLVYEKDIDKEDLANLRLYASSDDEYSLLLLFGVVGGREHNNAKVIKVRKL
jgi:hypothetical protein